MPDGKNAQHATRSIHRGRHTQEAMDSVSKRMDDVLERGQAQNWSQAQYRNELRTLLADEWQGLRQGATDLYAKRRPWFK